ncbi:MAG TPA: NAD(P)/FAD-dependent oxidoreductase [Acidimicrobiia bacterium]
MTASRRHQVLVVGAGLAGLVAARRLIESGLETVVLEARDRVGGRLWSLRLGNAEIVELGGEWISTSQHAVIDLARELGLDLVATGMDFTTRDPVDGPSISKQEHHALASSLSTRMSALGQGALESMSAETLLDDLGLLGPAMTVLRSRLEGTAGAPLAEVAAAEIGLEFGIGDDGSYVRIEGGNDRLARRLAKGVDIEFEKTVTSIHQSSDGVEVVMGNAVIAAEAVVVAVPLGVLKRMVFEPDLPEETANAVDTLGMGAGAKIAVATIGEPEMFRRQDTDIPAWYWTGNAADGSVRRAITGFAGTRRGVETLLEQARPRLARAAGGSHLSGAPLVVDWSSDIFAGGCYSVIGPGQRRLLDVLSQPWGRVFLAGEHVNGSGTIEGAILSGEAAARRLQLAQVV